MMVGQYVHNDNILDYDVTIKWKQDLFKAQEHFQYEKNILKSF